MDWLTIGVFVFVYAGMILGGVPGLALDRTGVALTRANARLAPGRLAPREARDAVDTITIALLFALMGVSAQLRLGGFYTAVTRRLAAVRVGPVALLGLVVAVAGALSAVLANDIVCLAMAPILAQGGIRRGLNPVPLLLGLACAANVGSAATLIGNPQNMLIGQVLGLDFGAYLLAAGPPALLGLGATWGLIALLYRGRWTTNLPEPEVEAPNFGAWQSAKGLAVLAALVAVFLWGGLGREVAALLAAGLLLLSRRMASRTTLALVDWQLLVLFIGLFVVNHAVAAGGVLSHLLGALRALGLDVTAPGQLYAATAALSNLVSNVPAVMLLLPVVQPLPDPTQAGTLLALSSTLAGNLIVVGSIANIIVIDQAARLGIRISWTEHARTGLPVTLTTLAIAWALAG
jgi:Na+/H+ antiporter NhaD/arsenite permease-like protein